MLSVAFHQLGHKRKDAIFRQADRQTDRQTDRQAGRQAGRQTDRQTDRQYRLITLSNRINMFILILFSELPFGWEKVEDPHYGVYYIE